MAPNSITLLGLAINLLTTLLLISYCPTATEEVGPAFRSRPARGASAAEEGPPTAVPGTPRSQSQPRPSAQLSRRWRRPGSGETPARMTLPGRGGGQTQPLPRAASATETPAGRLEAVAPLPQVRVYPELPRAAEGLSRSLPQPGSTPASPGHWEPGACLSGLHPGLARSCGMDKPSVSLHTGGNWTPPSPAGRAPRPAVGLAKPELPFGHFYNRFSRLC